MQLTGSQIIIECLKEQGVDTVFGYPGGTILNVYDELYSHPEIHHILTSHEQGAAHAADGYAASRLPIWIPRRSWRSRPMWEDLCSEKTVFRRWTSPAL